MTIQQRRALFDFICGVIVLAVLMYGIGSTIGCGSAATTSGLSAAPTYTPTSNVRHRPVRIDEQIVRVDDWHCRLATAPGAVAYTQGGVVRSITTPFPCPTVGEAKQRWGSGQRRISIEYNDGTYSSITEWWP